MNNLTVAKRLGLGFGVVVALLVLVAWMGIGRLGDLHASLEDITNDK
jgi:methyl-accepting chemotaxis protein